MISRAQEGQPHIKLLDFLCANKYLQKTMFKTKTHPYHGKHIREGYRDQSAKPTLSPIVKKRWEISFSIKIIFQIQVLHWCDLPPCVPLLPGCLGPGGCPGSQVWRHPSYAVSNRFNGNDKNFIYIGVFSVFNTIKLLRYLVHIGMSQVTPRSIQFCVFSISSFAINLPR